TLLRCSCITGRKTACLLFQKARHHPFARRSLAALTRLDLSRIGNKLRGRWCWPRPARLRLAHPVAVLFGLVAILPIGYLAYCIATLPLAGGLVIEPSPSALVV